MDGDTVMAVLKSSRKARKQTTCYPCQRRKVKCDRGLPCAVCVSRGHSFLCSYGRPTELSRAPSSLNSASEDTHPCSDNHYSPPDPQVQLSALREQLNNLHQELCEARKRHKQCEEAEDQVRRLQARCKEYEDVHLSLRAGDWSALARIDDMIKGDSDTSSTVLDGSGYLQDARLGGSTRGASQMTDVSMNASTTHSSNMNSVSATHLHESTSCSVPMSETQQAGPPVRSTLNVQQPQSMFEQRNVPNSSAVYGLPETNHGANISYVYEAIPQSTLQPSTTNLADHITLLPQTASNHVQRNQRILPATHSGIHQENSNFRPSLVSGSTLIQSNQHEQSGRAFQNPSFFENSNNLLSDQMSAQAEMSSGAAWTQISLFPPMMSTQDLEFMERNYADYWARIVVEAQQSTLLAG